MTIGHEPDGRDLSGRSEMSFVIAMPEVLGTAATDLTSLGSTLSEANAAAATQTTGVLTAARG